MAQYAIIWIGSWLGLFMYFFGAWHHMLEPLAQAKPLTRIWMVPALLLFAPLWVIALMLYHVIFEWNI